ncbi:MAG: hypothetical protein ACON5A_02505 [Candidatus Comchoanobacterales bacterium]
MSIAKILDESFSHLTHTIQETERGQNLLSAIPEEYRSFCQILKVDVLMVVIGVRNQAALFWLRLKHDELAQNLSKLIGKSVDLKLTMLH